MASKIVITDAGLAEVINATHTGTSSVALTEVGLGTGKYEASKAQTALQAEFKRLTSIAGGAVADDLIHFTVLDDSADAYEVYEFGVYTESGTLFAVYSQTTPIVQKASGSQAFLAVDIKLADISATSLTIGDTNFVLPPATTEKLGLVELATADEVIAGSDSYRAVTAASLVARTATTARTGLVELATTDEGIQGKSGSLVMTPYTTKLAIDDRHRKVGEERTRDSTKPTYGLL